MSNWESIRLGDYSEIGRGSSPRPIKNQAYFDGGTIPWIKIADATSSFKYIHETKQYVNEYGASFSRKLPPGSLIVAASGTLGFAIFLGVEGCVHDGWLYFQEIDETKLDKQFLYYLLNTLTNSFNSFSYGAAIQNINTTILRNTKFFCPPLPVQQKIAAILSAYDDLIENNQQRIALLEKAAEQIYREWFVRMRFPGWEQTKFEKGVPVGWKLKKLGELANTQYGYTASATDETIGPKFLRITDIVPNTITWNEVPFCAIDENLRDKYLLHEGDIVVARTGATVGYAKRINKLHPDTIFASYLVRLKPKKTVQSIFLGIAIESKGFKNFIGMFITGAAQPQANAKIMSSFPLLLPPENLLIKFNNLVEPILDKRELLNLTNSKIRKSRDLLLSRLISGKLAVDELEIHFPPSMKTN